MVDMSKLTQEKQVVVYTRLPAAADAAELERRAAEADRTMSAEARRAIRKYLTEEVSERAA